MHAGDEKRTGRLGVNKGIINREGKGSCRQACGWGRPSRLPALLPLTTTLRPFSDSSLGPRALPLRTRVPTFAPCCELGSWCWALVILREGQVSLGSGVGVGQRWPQLDMKREVFSLVQVLLSEGAFYQDSHQLPIPSPCQLDKDSISSSHRNSISLNQVFSPSLHLA